MFFLYIFVADLILCGIPVIRSGFLIEENKIYDTKIQYYSLEKKYIDGVLVYYMLPKKYKRLFDFEILLDFYDIDKVFRILEYNSTLKKNREIQRELTTHKLNYISTCSTIYNYPIKYLTQKKFNCYKICQNLKKRLD